MAGGKFAGYPEPKQLVLEENYRAKKVDANPVLRGMPLAITANVVSRFGFLSKYLWANAHFGSIQEMSVFGDLPIGTFHPCVIPLDDGETKPNLLAFSGPLVTPQPANLVGRYHSVADFHEAYKSKEVTPLQVVETILRLTTRGQTPRSKYDDAWVSYYGNEDRIREAARASTERYARGKSLGLLDGVPFGVKDDIDVKGYVTHYGMRYNPKEKFFSPAKESIWAVRKIEEAGGIMVGKNVMHELGTDITGCNPSWGTPTNWHNKAFYTGGSSSGASSSLMAGVVPLAIATDAGGSIRVPSAWGGLYGLKPTHHRTHVMDSSMCVIGPIASTVADLTIAYRTMSQPDPQNDIQSRFAPSQPPSPSAPKVIGINRWGWDLADPWVRGACDEALQYFSDKLGYEIVDITIPYISDGQIAHSSTCVTELVQITKYRTEDPANWLSLVNPANRLILSVAAQTGASDYVAYNRIRHALMQHFAHLFQKYPGLIVLSPTVPSSGWPINPADQSHGLSDTNRTVASMCYVFLANTLGCPALSAPVGYVDTENGSGRMPTGMMAMGEWGAEEQLLSWAGEVETYLNTVYEGGRKKPDEWVDLLNLAKEGGKAATAGADK